MKKFAFFAVVFFLLFGILVQAKAESFLKEGDSYSEILYPGSISTIVNGINNAGKIIGNYDSSSIFYGQSFLKDGDNYSSFNYPLAHTVAKGINDSDTIVGYYYFPSGEHINHGFIKSGNSFSSFDFPGAYSTTPTGINNSGQIVGHYYESFGTNKSHGFIKTGESIIQFDYPGAISTYIFGNNDSGELVGLFRDETGVHDFLWDNGVFTLITYLGYSVDPRDINNLGQIVGNLCDGNTCRGYLKDGDTFSFFEIQDSWPTVPSGLNDNNSIVGNYSAPPSSVSEPVSLSLLFLGFLGIFGLKVLKE